jgi:hypothetical protein
MHHSPEIKAIASALSKARAEFKEINKNKTANIRGQTAAGKEYEYEYSYADLACIFEATIPALAKHELSISQGMSEDGKNLITLLMHSSGEWIETFYPITVEPEEITDQQSVGGANTYSRRYALNGVLNVFSETDTDGNKTKTSAASKDPEAVPFGPFKGKKFSDVTRPELIGAYEWAKKNEKFAEFQAAASKFLSQPAPPKPPLPNYAPKQ